MDSPIWFNRGTCGWVERLQFSKGQLGRISGVNQNHPLCGSIVTHWYLFLWSHSYGHQQRTDSIHFNNSHVSCESSVNTCVVDHFTSSYGVKHQLKWWLDSARRSLSCDAFGGNARKPKVISGDDLVMMFHIVQWWWNRIIWMFFPNCRSVPSQTWNPNRNTAFATQQLPTCIVGELGWVLRSEYCSPNKKPQRWLVTLESHPDLNIVKIWWTPD